MAGIKREYLASQNFVMIHLSLIDHGLSWEAAGVLHRIDYRSGGGGWWTVTKGDMQKDMRISERKLDRALDELRGLGLLRSERASSTTALTRWSVNYAEPTLQDETSRSPGGRFVPLPEQDETSRSSTKNVENKDSSSPDGDGGVEDQPKTSAPGVDALFTDWWRYYPKKVSKKDARTAFEKALKRTNFEVLRAGLVASVKTWRLEGRVVVEGAGESLTVKLAAGTPEKRELAKGVPHAATWLNADRWEDEHEAAPAATANGEGTSWMHRTPANTV